MILGTRLQAHPTAAQKKTLSQWMGCARYLWNAKTREEKEGRGILNSKETKKYPVVDQSYAHLKSKEETPWLYECPSVILRNSIAPTKISSKSAVDVHSIRKKMEEERGEEARS